MYGHPSALTLKKRLVEYKEITSSHAKVRPLSERNLAYGNVSDSVIQTTLFSTSNGRKAATFQLQVDIRNFYSRLLNAEAAF